jgi:hypothetical protein
MRSWLYGDLWRSFSITRRKRAPGVSFQNQIGGRMPTGRGPVLGSRSVISINRANPHEGVTLRQAALIAGLSYLLNPC